LNFDGDPEFANISPLDKMRKIRRASRNLVRHIRHKLER
jgi:hypothetical protein